MQNLILLMKDTIFIDMNRLKTDCGIELKLIQNVLQEVLSSMSIIKWLFFLLSNAQIWLAQPGPIRTRDVRF